LGEITSPVDKCPGTVVIKSLTFPLFVEWKRVVEKQGSTDYAKDRTEACFELLPIICNCVEEWKLKGFPAHATADDFPAEDILKKLEIIEWLSREINGLFFGKGEQDPNG